MLERIVYVSRAASPGFAEICGIVRAAHRVNARLEVTGALLCLDGWFAQALEGPGPGLDALWERLARDPRHSRLDRRIRERGLCRLFACPLVLRTAADLDPGLPAAFGYRPGFPVEAFPAAVLLEFLVTACRRHGMRAGLDKSAALS
jgi:FAD-dependent sensor of blue light